MNKANFHNEIYTNLKKEPILNHSDSEAIQQLYHQAEEELDFDKLTEICENLKEALCEIFSSCGIYFRIFSRVKSADSLAKKITRRKYGSNTNSKKLQDLIGLRVVLYYYDDLSICRDIMEKTFHMVDKWSRSKYNADEFRATKINGVFQIPEEFFKIYQKEMWSMPIDKTFEIQFRTVFFEGWHEIEHDMRYKSFISDDEFWKGSEELSRILNCILANLELSDWSLVQLFNELSYNHYKNQNWELMLKSKYRIKMSNNDSLDPRILNIFDRDKEIAKQFFKASRYDLIRELLKIDNPYVNYNLIIKLINERIVHNAEIKKICDTIEPPKEDRAFQRNTLSRLESNILFHLELPLLHKENRKLDIEFNNAATILYKWARFKMNPVFGDIPVEISNYANSLPGFKMKIKYEPENMSFRIKLLYIDTKTIGTLWHVDATIGLLDDGKLHFCHMTSRDMPRGVSQNLTFLKPSYLNELSSKIGLMDYKRLGTKAQIISSSEQLHSLFELITSNQRHLPVVIITQFEQNKLSPEQDNSFGEYDMNTFTINGTRLAKVVGYYCHVAMIDYNCIPEFTDNFNLNLSETIGCICIFWPNKTQKAMKLFTREMVLNTQFDFNRFAFYENDIFEKAFRHKLVQLIKDDNVSR